MEFIRGKQEMAVPGWSESQSVLMGNGLGGYASVTGAYFRAWLKVNGNTGEAAAQVRQRLNALIPMLGEGCLGQLPEIYDGDFPAMGKGCYAQAWSVGEMLRVFDTLRTIEEG